MRAPSAVTAGLARLAGLAVLLAPGCRDEAAPPEPRAEPVARVLVVGVDGLEWNVVRPLLAEGRMPHLRALMERGTFGHLATMVPTLSPILWTTIATGRTPEQHGIHGFTDRDLRQYTSAQRRGRALWNIADEHELSCGVWGWWITWPAEPVRGTMVSGSSSSALVDANWKPALLPGAPDQVHPKELEPEVMAIAERAGAIGEVERLAREKVFGEIADAELGAVERRLIQETLWSIQSDATYFAIARELLAKRPADLHAVYFGGPDVAGHRFWRYYEPAAFAWPDAPQSEADWQKVSPGSAPLAKILAPASGAAKLAGVIPRYYAWFDEMLGELVAAAGAGCAVLVVSDHGMHASSTDVPNARFVTGHHQDGPPGVIVAAGPGIARGGDVAAFLERGELGDGGNILQVAPNVLALLGIPPSREMPERAHAALLSGQARENAALPPVATHDAGFRAPTRVDVPEQMTGDFLERFQGLGYVGMEGSDVQQPAVVDPKTFRADTSSPVKD